MDLAQAPASLEEVEILINRMYQPAAPGEISRIQETLQTLQRSAEGWQLANSLLGRKEQNVRFFGALTYIVKLNTDFKSLSRDEAYAILQSIIGWLVHCLDNSEGPLVIRKLCSALVVYFLYFSQSWALCVRHLIFCLCVDQSTAYQTLENGTDINLVIQSMPHNRALTAFWFATSLVEEVGKTDSNSIKQHKYHDYLRLNVEDTVAFISRYIPKDDQSFQDIKVHQEALKCLQAWILYSHRAFIDADIVLEPLRNLTQPAILCLLKDDLYEIAIELFSEVLANYPKFLRDQDLKLLYSLLNSAWAEQKYFALTNGDYEFESVQFGHFMVSFGEATVLNLVQNAATNIETQKFLSALIGLLGSEGYAIGTDKIFVVALEFWNAYTEVLIDASYEPVAGEMQIWQPAAQAYLVEAIKKIWQKIQFPPIEIFKTWDSADKTAFKDARRDVSDLLQQSCLLLGHPVLVYFTDMTIYYLEKGCWAELEACLFCLTQFSDSLSNFEVIGYECLNKVFGSSLFITLFSMDIDSQGRVLQTCLTLIESYADHFNRIIEHLPNALNLAFRAIEFPNIARKASRTINLLCSSCRKTLIPELDAFLQQFEKTYQLPSLEISVREGVLGAISSIIQAVPDEESKLAPLGSLLSHIETDLQLSFQIAAPDLSREVSSVTPRGIISNNDGPELALASLRCLASIARGLQAPHDTPLDLEEKRIEPPFWEHGKGLACQKRIFEMIHKAYNVFGHYGEIIEAICVVFRAGFIEHSPGPFIFRQDFISQFFLATRLETPRLGFIISTACSFLSSHSATRTLQIDSTFDGLLSWMIQVLQALREPGSDPEITQNGIEFLHRMILSRIHILLNQNTSTVEFVFFFILRALIGSDPLPKAAAAEFLSTYIVIKDQEDGIQTTINNIVMQFGPSLAQALIYNIGGQAARSELDKVSEPLKRLVTRQVQSKKWLEAALLDDKFPSDKVTLNDKIVFLQKIINLRGAKGTNLVVREFWLACRGSNFAYVS